LLSEFILTVTHIQFSKWTYFCMAPSICYECLVLSSSDLIWNVIRIQPQNWYTVFKLRLFSKYLLKFLISIFSGNLLSFLEILWYFLFNFTKFRESHLRNFAKYSNTGIGNNFAKYEIYCEISYPPYSYRYRYF
jgi:hypothetical protein